MKNNCARWPLITIFLLGLAPGYSLHGEAPASDVFVFSYFLGNGDGLHWARSEDGLNWTAVGGGRSFLTPVVGENRLMRDPCVARGPDGIFRLVWTTSWAGHTIGYASSPDLLHWSEEKAIPVMAREPTAENSWAPEVIYDPVHRDYLIFWATSIPGRFPGTDATGHVGSDHKELNHRIYSTTTTDFQAFTSTKLFFDPGFSVIDATILPANGQFHLIFKDETRFPVAKKDLRLATSTRIDGPYTAISAPFTDHWVEGPTAIKIGDDYVVYFDCYTRERYGAVRSRDLKTWEDASAQLVMPKGARHGTVLKVPGSLIANLITTAASH